MDREIRISVCMATYNGSKYVKQQLTSILEQLGDHDEVIITDDCSSDDTVSIIKGIGDVRIRIYQNDTNLGYTRNFEKALSHARGDYLFLSDQDDVWLPGKVTTVMEAFAQGDMIVTNATVTDGDLRVIHQSHFDLHQVRQGFVHNFLRTRYIGSSMAFTRAVLQRALPFPGDYLKAPHDYWLALIAEKYFRVKLLNQPFMLYRRHDDNASSGGLGNTTPIRWRISRRIYCLNELLKR